MMMKILKMRIGFKIERIIITENIKIKNKHVKKFKEIDYKFKDLFATSYVST